MDELLFIPEVLIFNIPPPAFIGGHQTCSWDLTPFWTGSLQLIAKSNEERNELEIQLVENGTAIPYANAPIEAYPGLGISQVTDSLYFVLRLMSSAGQPTFVGMGFRKEEDSFQLDAKLQECFRDPSQQEDSGQVAPINCSTHQLVYEPFTTHYDREVTSKSVEDSSRLPKAGYAQMERSERSGVRDDRTHRETFNRQFEQETLLAFRFRSNSNTGAAQADDLDKIDLEELSHLENRKSFDFKSWVVSAAAFGKHQNLKRGNLFKRFPRLLKVDATDSQRTLMVQHGIISERASRVCVIKARDALAILENKADHLKREMNVDEKTSFISTFSHFFPETHDDVANRIYHELVKNESDAWDVPMALYITGAACLARSTNAEECRQTKAFLGLLPDVVANAQEREPSLCRWRQWEEFKETYDKLKVAYCSLFEYHGI